jgi:hypothetical protein
LTPSQQFPVGDLFYQQFLKVIFPQHFPKVLCYNHGMNNDSKERKFGDGGENSTRRKHMKENKCTECGVPLLDRKGRCDTCLAKERDSIAARREQSWVEETRDDLAIGDYVGACAKHPTIMKKKVRGVTRLT